MAKSKFKTLTILMVLVFALLAVYLQHSLNEDPYHFASEKEPNLQESENTPFAMKGITYRNFKKGKLVSRVSADEIKVDQRKFWIFNIRPFKEAVLENAFIQVYTNTNSVSESAESAEAKEGIDLLSFGDDILSVGKEMNSNSMERGVISRGVIKDLVLEVYDADKLSISINSKKAYIDFTRELLKMVDVSMKEVDTGKHIESRSVIWNNKNRRFEIEGHYTAISRNQISDGNMIGVNLNFEITPLRSGEG